LGIDIDGRLRSQKRKGNNASEAGLIAEAERIRIINFNDILVTSSIWNKTDTWWLQSRYVTSSKCSDKFLRSEETEAVVVEWIGSGGGVAKDLIRFVHVQLWPSIGYSLLRALQIRGIISFSISSWTRHKRV